MAKFHDTPLRLLERLLALGVARDEASFIAHRQQQLDTAARAAQLDTPEGDPA